MRKTQKTHSTKLTKTTEEKHRSRFICILKESFSQDNIDSVVTILFLNQIFSSVVFDAVSKTKSQKPKNASNRVFSEKDWGGDVFWLNCCNLVTTVHV